METINVYFDNTEELGGFLNFIAHQHYKNLKFEVGIHPQKKKLFLAIFCSGNVFNEIVLSCKSKNFDFEATF